MKKIIFLFALFITLGAVSMQAQTASFTMKTEAYKTFNTNYTLTNGVADTFVFHVPRSYPATQAYSINLDSVSGNHTNIAVSLYGSLLGVTYTQIGSTINWVTGASPTHDTTMTIANTAANRYNYYQVIVLGTGTGVATIDWQKLQTWSAGNLSDGTATLSAGSFTGLVNVSGTGDVVMTGGDFTGANGNKIDIGEAADGTITLSRDDAGTVTLTSADSDANAALTIGAGGTGALTVGDAGSTTSITSSDWAIGATGAMTGIGAVTMDGTLTLENSETIVNSTNGTVAISGVLSANPRFATVVVNTDESETVTEAQSGAIITFDGAGTLTIPDPSAATIGVVYYALQTANANLIVTATTATGNSFVCDGVATSDAITISTSSHLIGAGMIIIGISATQWYVGALNPEAVLTPEAAD